MPELQFQRVLFFKILANKQIPLNKIAPTISARMCKGGWVWGVMCISEQLIRHLWYMYMSSGLKFMVLSRQKIISGVASNFYSQKYTCTINSIDNLVFYHTKQKQPNKELIMRRQNKVEHSTRSIITFKFQGDLTHSNRGKYQYIICGHDHAVTVLSLPKKTCLYESI